MRNSLEISLTASLRSQSRLSKKFRKLYRQQQQRFELLMSNNIKHLIEICCCQKLELSHVFIKNFKAQTTLSSVMLCVNENLKLIYFFTNTEQAKLVEMSACNCSSTNFSLFIAQRTLIASNHRSVVKHASNCQHKQPSSSYRPIKLTKN